MRFIARERKRTDKKFFPYDIRSLQVSRYKQLPFDYLDLETSITIHLTSVQSQLCDSYAKFAKAWRV